MAAGVAEAVGFEPTGVLSRLAPTVLKTAALNHSATPPDDRDPMDGL